MVSKRLVLGLLMIICFALNVTFVRARVETQKIDAQPKEAQSSFSEAFLQRKGSVPRAGFVP